MSENNNNHQSDASSSDSRSDASSSNGNRRPRRLKVGSSMLAAGEPMVWLTGGALVVSIVMVIGLLLLVLGFGMTTFWPGDVVQVKTHDGRTYMGEFTRDEDYRPEPTYLEDLSPELRRKADEFAEEDGGKLTRRLMRTGNFKLTQIHYAYINDFAVAERETPDWAVVIERLEWGRFYGFPHARVYVHHVVHLRDKGAAAKKTIEQQRDEAKQAASKVVRQFGDESKIRIIAERREKIGKEEVTFEDLLSLEDINKATRVLGVAEVHEGREQAWDSFNEHHAKIRARWEERRDLEKFDVGHVNHKQMSAQLNVADHELELQDAIESHGKDSEEAKEAAKALEVAKKEREETDAWASKEFAKIKGEIDKINEENGRYRILMRTSGEAKNASQFALLRMDDIVRAYRPNTMGFSDKFGVYLSRWWEFLFDEPREANSEGGVWPAIFGTVVMTVGMSLAVVPFGVLAALYLREYAKAGVIVSTVRIAVNNLAGVPSIVFGVFGLGFFCYMVGGFIDGGPESIKIPPMAPLGWWLLFLALVITSVAAFFVWITSMRMAGNKTASPIKKKIFKSLAMILWISSSIMIIILLVKVPFFDGFHRARLYTEGKATYGTGGLLWASLTLALLTLPVVIVATEEALAAVPGSMREGSYACGASKWQTIKRIVLPRAMPGIMTGTILAMARGAGEVAPLMLVGAVKLAPHLPIDGIFPYLHPERTFMHLGFHIYDLGFQSQNSEAAKPLVYTTTLLLILIVATLNIAAIYIRSRLRRKFVANQF